MLTKLFIFLGLVGLIQSSCMMRKAPEMGEKDVVVVCFFVTDLKADMATVPEDVNVVAIIIFESKIPKIETGVFERFGPTMERLEIHHSGVEDVEDHAFKGLTKVKTLKMRVNKLKEVRSGWMNDLTALTDVDLNSNMLLKVDKDVDVSRVEKVDVGDNKFKCIPVDMVNMMKDLKSFSVVMNPLSWKCATELDDWVKAHPDIMCDFVGKDLGFEHVFEIARECMKTVPDATVDDDIDTCVEAKMNAAR